MRVMCAHHLSTACLHQLARSIESLTQQIQELKVENRRLLKERKLEARSEDAQLTSVRARARGAARCGTCA